ncbi:DUF397 domain-containing protein [Streptomyces sp. NPDC005970]|uniref:DUF397 domain-containing protein n=1 Tax=Streptomyces sp. NPDC005970 TaxID=3156723 RepID=UPI003407CD2A
MSRYQWRKSSYSPNSSNCVNVAVSDHAVFLRESDDPDVVLTTTPAALRSFIRGTKAGRLDHVK